MIKSYNLLKLEGGVSEDFLCVYTYMDGFKYAVVNTLNHPKEV